MLGWWLQGNRIDGMDKSRSGVCFNAIEARMRVHAVSMRTEMEIL